MPRFSDLCEVCLEIHGGVCTYAGCPILHTPSGSGWHRPQSGSPTEPSVVHIPPVPTHPFLAPSAAVRAPSRRFPLQTEPSVVLAPALQAPSRSPATTEDA